MAGQIWSVAADGGFMYSDELSDTLRIQVQPLTKFRQLCDAQDGSKKGLNRGDKYNWNVYSVIGTQGRRLSESTTMPESGFTVQQHQLTVYEAFH
jgi:hypothetical protein